MDLKKYLSEKKEMIDDALTNYIDVERNYPETMHKAMRHSLLAGGKRLRPILVIAAAEAVGGASHKVLPAALALEMIHTFSLIHDDLPAMDDDDLRRGIPTCHKVFGEAAAILAGDALLNEAFTCILDAYAKDSKDLTKVWSVARDISRAVGIHGMIAGQVIDMESENKSISLHELEKLHNLKTGALITVSVTAGAKLCDATPKQMEALTNYAEHIGLAFQVSDDILDIEGDEKLIGKPVGSDVENMKSTYPKLLGIEESKKFCGQLVENAVDALSIFDEKADALREIAKYIRFRKS